MTLSPRENERTNPKNPPLAQPSFQFRSGGAGQSRLAGKLRLVLQVVVAAAPESLSSVSLGVLEEAVSHFLQERGLAPRPRESSGGSSSSRSNRARDSGRSSKRWERDEIMRLRIRDRLNAGLEHDPITVED